MKQIFQKGMMVTIAGFAICNYGNLWSAKKKSSTITVNFPPPHLHETCQKYQELKLKGLNVKAERLINEYKRKELRVFADEPDATNQKQRVFRLLAPEGWELGSSTFNGPKFYFESKIGVNEHGHNEYRRTVIAGNDYSGVKIPEKMQEDWEDILHHKFNHRNNRGLNSEEQWYFSEIVVREGIDYNDRRARISICDEHNNASDFELHGDLVLVSYKVQRRTSKKIDDNSSKSPESAEEAKNDESPKTKSSSTESEPPKSVESTPRAKSVVVTPAAKRQANFSEDFKSATSIKRTDDLHADMINAILTQHPERYEFIKEVLIADPDRVDAMTMKIVVDIDHKFESKKKTETMGLLTSAVIAKDFEMVKLLIENNAMICSTPANNLCALGVARKLGYQDIVDAMHKELLRRHEEMKKNKP